MPPRISLFVAPFRGGSVVPSVMQRFAPAATICSSARLYADKGPASSSGAFLNLERESQTQSGSSNNSRSARDFANANANANTPNSNPSLHTNATISRLLFNSESRTRMVDRRDSMRQSTLERMAERKTSDDYARQMPRRWTVGEVYSPHDLGAREARKWRSRVRKEIDIVDVLGINPIDEYRNFAMVSEYVSRTGRIRHSGETGLRPVNQRRMAKAIRRAVGLGIHPSAYRHPELLGFERKTANYPHFSNNNRNRQT